MARRIPAIIGVGLLWAGCAEYSASGDRSDEDPSGATSTSADTGDGGSPSSTDSETYPTPAWWSVELAFEVLAGEIVGKAGPVVTVDLWTDGEPPEPLCRQTAPVVSAEAQLPPALPQFEDGDVGLASWWRLDLDAGPGDVGCPAFEARTVWFGLGPYDARLDPAAAAAGLLGTPLYGLYLSEAMDGPVYVVGVAGTAEMYAGGYAPDPEATPVPDGLYTAESLILLAL